MKRLLRVTSFLMGVLACSGAHADLLGYWSANAGPNDDFVIANDAGNSDYDALFGGDATWTEDGGGVTGAAGDFGMQFNGVDEDFAEANIEGITYEEITISAWVKGHQTGAWSGLFQTRDGAPPIGIGYNGDSGRLTYTWNDNNGNTWDFPANHPNGDDLIIPEDEWAFVALSVEPDAATLYVGAQGGTLNSVANEIPQLVQTPPGTGWRMGEDNCCGAERNFEGVMDDVAIWDHRLTAAEIAELHSMEKIPTDFTERMGGLREVQVGGGSVGSSTLSGTVTNVQRGEAMETNGLTQYWFEGSLVGNVEFFLDNGETGTDANPLVAEPFASSTTWWSGGQDSQVITDYPIENYPQEGLAGTRFAGSANADNYSVRLTGEIFIPADGEYIIRDGIDDFAMVAIDQDGNGELDELSGFSSADVNAGQFGDVLILDDDWANIDGSSTDDPNFQGFPEFENVGADGDWRSIEIWMSEGGGGDAGILYMASLDDSDVWDENNAGGLTQEERDKFVVRSDRLRSTVSVVESADSSAALATNVQYKFQTSADGSSDQFVVADNGGLYNTTLDVTGATLVIEAGEGLTAGQEFTIFNADNILGTDTLNITADGFDLSRIADGVVCFGSCDGAVGGLPGDIDGDGTVAFADFLILSSNFGTMVAAGTNGDIDGDGSVAFADFLVLSANFGTSAAASPVPEPTGLTLIGVAALAAGLLRRRR